jgi:hypothetical protein
MKIYPPRSRKGLIQQANANAISTRIKTLPTIKEKQELVVKTNPFLHIFGMKLTPTNHYTKEYKDDQA